MSTISPGIVSSISPDKGPSGNLPAPQPGERIVIVIDPRAPFAKVGQALGLRDVFERMGCSAQLRIHPYPSSNELGTPPDVRLDPEHALVVRDDPKGWPSAGTTVNEWRFKVPPEVADAARERIHSHLQARDPEHMGLRERWDAAVNDSAMRKTLLDEIVAVFCK